MLFEIVISITTVIILRVLIYEGIVKNVKRSYTIAFKRAAIAHFNKSKSKNQTTPNLKIPRPTLISWIKEQNNILNPKLGLDQRRNKNESHLKQAKFYENEQRIFSRIIEQRRENFCVTSTSIRLKMLEDVKANPIGEDSNEFIASYGWLQRFMKR